MCSPYDYMEMEAEKVGIIPEQKSGSRSQKNLKEVNSNGGEALIDFSFIVESILATVKRERREISRGRKYSGTSFYLSYFFIPILIVLTLGFFPLTNSAVLVHRLQQPNNRQMLMDHQNEKHVLIQRPSILSEDEGKEKDADVTSSPLLVIKNGSVNHEEDDSTDSGEDRKTEQRLTNKMSKGEGKEELNCTQPTILDFPLDLITKIPSSSSVLIHVIISLYIFYAIAYLCHAFFVPSVDLICKVLHVPSDVAGATWMAIATSSPEFFTNVIGTFLTQGGIGVGSVVGSVVFNLLSIIAWCGLFTKVALKLDWWPLTRDLFSYIFSVILLIVILWDGRIYWYEGLVLVLSYTGYIAIMCNNSRVEETMKNWIRKEMRMSSPPIPSVDRLRELLINSLSYDGFKGSSETTPLLNDKSGRSLLTSHLSDELNRNISASHTYTNGGNDLVSKNTFNQIKTRTQKKEEPIVLKIHEKEFGLFELPRGQSCLKWFEWIMGWPVRLILHVTIPDCRLLTYTNWYPVTFCICILYMALFSYIISWMMTVLGQTLGITDSIMGLTFISMGTTLPETISSIIVARQGYGSMGVSNSVGSNTFNILLCLGLPWFLRTLMLIIGGAGETFIPMTEGGFGHISIFLLTSALLMYFLIVWNDYLLDFKIGVMALLLYIIFLIFASLLELNVFFPVNLPTCPLN